MMPSKTLIVRENQSDKQLAEQLNFIYKVSGDIGKITTEIAKTK
jgi:hypothetical protein